VVAVDRVQVFEARCRAVDAALRYLEQYPAPPTVPGVLQVADTLLGYYLAPAAVLRIRTSPETFSLSDPAFHQPTKYTTVGDGLMAVALQPGFYVTLTADPLAADGTPVADTGLVWAADQPALVSLVPSTDGTEVNVGVPAGTADGTVNVTVTDSAGIVSPADPIVIAGGPPTTLGITASTPQPIPSGGVPVPPGA
jgi:hypothetical protein